MLCNGQPVRLSLLCLSLILALTSCTTTPEGPNRTQAEAAQRATQLAQEREQTLATLRTEVATTRILAAKQEAELQELRTTVTQLRQENNAAQQALLEARRTLDARETEIAALNTEQEQRTRSTSSLDSGEHKLAALHDIVMSLHQDLLQVKLSLAILAPHATTHASSSHVGTPRDTPRPEGPSRESTQNRLVSALYVVPDATSHPNVSRVTIRPGDTLTRIARRHQTTVEALRIANGLTGHLVRAGQELRLP